MAKSRMKLQIERKLKRQDSSSVIGKNMATSKLKTGKTTKTSVKKQSTQKVDLRSRQYSLGRDSDSNVHYYKFTGKQTKNWKPVGKPLKEYLYHLIDSGVRMVGSKPQFSNNEDVQKLLDELKLQLKSKLLTVRVPNKRHGDYGKIKVKIEELREEFESLTQQQLQLEKAVREEERSIEALEDLQNTSSSAKLMLKIPEEKLGLPRMVF